MSSAGPAGGAPSARPLTVLVAGGSGASGIAVARALAAAGHRVATAGSDQARITEAARKAGDGVSPFACDLAVLADVRRLRDDVTGALGAVDGVIHLVGGWRGAKGIADQSDDDWDFLERGAITTLRNVSRVFFDDIAASTSGKVCDGFIHCPGSARRSGRQLRGGESRRGNLDHGHGRWLPPGLREQR